MSSALRPSNIDITKVSFSTPKTLDNGGKMIYLNYNGGINPFYVATPEAEVIWDPNYFADDGKSPEDSKSGKYSITFSMKNSDKGMDVFHDKFVELDEHIMKTAMENSQAWFKKPRISEDAIRELYTPQVKISLNPDTGEPSAYPPKFTYKVVKKENKFQNFKIYDNDKKVFDVNKTTDEGVEFQNVVMKGALVKVVLKCNGVWIAQVAGWGA